MGIEWTKSVVTDEDAWTVRMRMVRIEIKLRWGVGMWWTSWPDAVVYGRHTR